VNRDAVTIGITKCEEAAERTIGWGHYDRHARIGERAMKRIGVISRDP
jgi:hypothetical protein